MLRVEGFKQIRVQVTYMVGNRMLKVGIIGTIVTAVCCFTPILLILLSAIGLSAFTGYLDVILLPALAIFILITGYALWKRERR